MIEKYRVVYEDVVSKKDDNEFANVNMGDISNYGLKWGRGIGEPKGYDNEFNVAMMGWKDSFPEV